MKKWGRSFCYKDRRMSWEKVGGLLSEGTRISLKIISELQIAWCSGLFPERGCAVRLQTMPNFTSLHPPPLPPPQFCKALVENRASDVIPTCFCSVYSVQEGIGRRRWCYGFGLLVVPELLIPKQVGSSVLLVIAGLHLRSQVLRETRETICTSPCCSSGIINNGMDSCLFPPSPSFPAISPSLPFYPLGHMECVLNFNFGVSLDQTVFLGGFEEL